MQAHRVEFTIDRLRSIKANLKEAEQVLLDNIAGLRIANPNQKPRGTNYAKRMLRDKPLWQKVVYAHTLSMDSKAKIDPNLSDSNDFDSDEETELSKALKKMSAKDAKVEFERHDYTVSGSLLCPSFIASPCSHSQPMLIPTPPSYDSNSKASKSS